MAIPVVDRLHLHNGIVYIRCAGRVAKYSGLVFRGYNEDQIDYLIRNSIVWFYSALYSSESDEDLYGAIEASIEKFSGENRENAETKNPLYESSLINIIPLKDFGVQGRLFLYEFSSLRNEIKDLLRMKGPSVSDLMKKLGIDISQGFVQESIKFLSSYDFRNDWIYSVVEEELTSLLTLTYRKRGYATILPEVIYKFIESISENKDQFSQLRSEIRHLEFKRKSYDTSKNRYMRRLRNYISLLHSRASDEVTSKVFKGEDGLYLLSDNTIIKFSDGKVTDAIFFEIVRYLYSRGKIDTHQMFNLAGRVGLFMTLLSRIEDHRFRTSLKPYQSRYAPVSVKSRFTDRTGKILGRKYSIKRVYKTLTIYEDDVELVVISDYSFSLESFFRSMEIYLEVKIIN